MKRLKAWLNEPVDWRYEFVMAAFVGLKSIVTTVVTYHNAWAITTNTDVASGNNSITRKSGRTDVDGKLSPLLY